MGLFVVCLPSIERLVGVSLESIFLILTALLGVAVVAVVAVLGLLTSLCHIASPNDQTVINIITPACFFGRG